MNDQTMLPWSDEPTKPVKPKNLFNVLQRRKKDGKVDVWVPKRSYKTAKLEALTKARLRYPDDRYIKNTIYEEVKEVTDKDPFLAYEDENEVAYRVHDHTQEVLVVPKERAIPEPFPVRRPEPIQKAYRFMLWAALGLILSGLGAIIFAPVAGWWATRAINGRTDPRDRTRAWVTFFLAVLLFLVGLLLAFLFWIHMAS